MLDNYIINDLLIGRLVTVTNQGWIHGPNSIYEGPYIFYRTSEDKYMEVFTETEYSYRRPSSTTTRKNYKVSNNTEKNEFGKTYIEPTDSILSYLTDNEKAKLAKNPSTALGKKRIIEIYKAMVVKSIEQETQMIEPEKQHVKTAIQNNHKTA